MGFLSRIVADARAHAPMVRATARDVDRTQAAAEGGEIVEAGPPLSPPSPSPSGVELAATLSATPPMAVAPRSATRSAPAHDDRNTAPDPAARAAGDRPGLPVVPSSSPASPAAARAAMTASGAPSTPQPLASRRAPVSAEPARSRIDEAAARQVRAGVPDSRPAGAPEHTHARVDQRPAARATDDRGGPAREAPIAQIDTAAPPGGRTEPAAPQATRAAAPSPPLLEAIPAAEPQATPAARSDSLVPAPRVEISPSARATEPRRPERPSPMTEPVAARGVHIGRLEVIVAAPSQPPARPAQRGSADLASRRYLRNA
jgi:hypothetical protein